MLSLMLKLLFCRRTVPAFSTEERDRFEEMYLSAIRNNGVVCYSSELPKSRFIDYLIQEKSFVAHGSNRMNIERFEPREQTLYNGELVNAVFATKDGVWPMFYAILDRSKVVGNFRNGCLRTANDTRHYFFSLTKKTIAQNPWICGTIYLLSSDTFERTHKSRVYFDEWISRQEAKPVLRLEVSAEDFEYRDKISAHKPEESIVTTWLRYKFRTSRSGR
ncbi:hypothetical protein [Cohnella sp. GCM10027633]|uniref:hypothetical protein n=1 Tax=unclassified Cohnella TaxID=2636738 RepID=UPI003644E942